MNMRRFGVLLVIVGLIVIAFGAYLWTTGKAADGTMVGSGSAMDIIAQTSTLEARRASARGPLMLGGIVTVLGVLIAASARREGTS